MRSSGWQSATISPVILHPDVPMTNWRCTLKRIDVIRAGGRGPWFRWKLQQARFIELGYMIGVGGTITHPRASKTRDVMAQLPLTSLLLETDAPDMPLNGFSGPAQPPGSRRRAFFDVPVSCVRELEDVIARALLENTRAVFGITL